MAIVGGYSIYQWGLLQLQPVLEQAIEKLEQQLLEEPVEEQLEKPVEQQALLRQPKGRPLLAVWQARSRNFLKKGSVLVGGVFAGGDLFRRALNLTIVPGLQQIVRALAKIPGIVGTVALGAMAPIARVGLFLLSPLSKLSLYGATLTGAWGLGLIRGFVGEDVVGALAPFLVSIQSFFAMPAGASFTEFFLEKCL